MRIYVVTAGDGYDGYEVDGYYSTEEKAQARVQEIVNILAKGEVFNGMQFEPDEYTSTHPAEWDDVVWYEGVKVQ